MLVKIVIQLKCLNVIFIESSAELLTLLPIRHSSVALCVYLHTEQVTDI